MKNKRSFDEMQQESKQCESLNSTQIELNQIPKMIRKWARNDIHQLTQKVFIYLSIHDFLCIFHPFVLNSTFFILAQYPLKYISIPFCACNQIIINQTKRNKQCFDVTNRVKWKYANS